MSKGIGINALLAQKHANDVFVEECKNGPTQRRAHRRLDAWALKRSWSPVTAVGYEIKTQRSDFLRDDKWPAYLPCCHQLYFVCPYGLIQLEELPPEVGLMWRSKTGTRLFTKRKASHREITLPESLLLYVLMSRAHIVPPNFYQRETDAQQWRLWLERREENRDLGFRVRQALGEETRKILDENAELKARMEQYDTVAARIRELGFDPDRPIAQWQVSSKLEELASQIPRGLEGKLRHHANDLNRAADAVKAIVEAAHE